MGGGGGAVGNADGFIVCGLQLGVCDADLYNGAGLVSQLNVIARFEGVGGEQGDAAHHVGERALYSEGKGQRDDA